jgi:hypothetical protein
MSEESGLAELTQLRRRALGEMSLLEPGTDGLFDPLVQLAGPAEIHHRRLRPHQ